jgi:hypothetical protein
MTTNETGRCDRNAGLKAAAKKPKKSYGFAQDSAVLPLHFHSRVTDKHTPRDYLLAPL